MRLNCACVTYLNIVQILKYSRERMVLSAKSRGRGALGCITYFGLATVYNGVTHDPQNSFVVEQLDLQRQ